MKNLFCSLLVLVLACSQGFAQTPQFVLVHNGTSSVYTSWDATYAQAADGDNIYLPGTTLTSPINLDKRLYLYGAGIHPDSSASTGRTNIDAYIFIYGKASGGSIEGLNFINGNYIYFYYTNRRVNRFQIKRCLASGLNFTNSPTPTDSIPTNINITESILGNISGFNSQNNTFSKNIIGVVSGVQNCEFRNNIFIAITNHYNFHQSSACSFYNNIFLEANPFNYSPNTYFFYNNLKVGYSSFGCQCTEINNFSVPTTNDIFMNFANGGFQFTDNYRLKPTSAGKNAGNDGTDVGIYGTSSPTPAGWVPSNPHIYYKQVAAQTNAGGVIPIRIKVRTGN